MMCAFGVVWRRLFGVCGFQAAFAVDDVTRWQFLGCLLVFWVFRLPDD